MKIMKQNIIFLSILCFFISSCKDNFLDLKSVQNPTVDALYSSKSGLEYGLIGLYDGIQNFYTSERLPTHLELRSDNSQFGERPVQNAESYYTDNYIYGVTDYWRIGYNLIKNSYVLDEYLDIYLKKNIGDDEKKEVLSIKGEAAFLRALAYFDMVRYYGPIPKVTEALSADELSKAYSLGLAPVSEIYKDIIIPDLQFAVNNCKTRKEIISEGKVGRATQGSALAVLGDVYLTIGDYANAKNTLQIFYNKKNQQGYEYVPLTDIFFDTRKKAEAVGENTAESVFEIQWSIEDGTQYYKWLAWDARDLCGSKTVTQDGCPSPSLMAAYTFERNMADLSKVVNQNDRFSATINTSRSRGTIKSGDYYLGFCLKYLEYDIPVERSASWRNYVLYRLSDVTLMLAEATYMSGGGVDAAKALINEVRSIRKVSDPFNIDFWKKVEDPTALTAVVKSADQRTEKEAFIYGILHERRLELAFECKRYYDLKRTGKLLEFVKAKILTGDLSRNKDEVVQTLNSGEQQFYRIPDEIISENSERYSH
jgi:hypothetical protein